MLINERPFSDADIDSIRSNCVMDNNPKKVACLHINTGGYIYIPLLNEQEELIGGNNINLENVILIRLCHRNIEFDSRDDERIGLYIPINNKDIEIGSKIQSDGKTWEVARKRSFNKYELDYVESAYVGTFEPHRYVLFFWKDGRQTKIPLSRFGVACPVGSSIDLLKASLVTYHLEGYGNFLRVEVNENTNKTEDNQIKKRAAKEQEEDEKTNNKNTAWSCKEIITLLVRGVIFILCVLFLYVLFSMSNL